MKKLNGNNKALSLGKRTMEIAVFAFQNPLLTQVEIAVHFDISPQRVNQILNSDRVLNAFPQYAKRRVKSLIPKAIDRLEHLMNQNENYAVSEKVVSKILDQADILSPQPQVIVHELRFKSVEELQAIVDEGKKLNGPVIDGELID